ncbi:MAG: hypothetical protein NUV74_12385 [Candidatus Brocadiaceae bacterium]|nr:hypothetical protein [Candidatus Brocadiaceae bacterium]
MPLAFSIYYTEEEEKLLEEICKKKDIPFSAIEQLIEEESDFHGMGRRKGLFPAIRRIVEEATEKRLRKD